MRLFICAAGVVVLSGLPAASHGGCEERVFPYVQSECPRPAGPVVPTVGSATPPSARAATPQPAAAKPPESVRQAVEMAAPVPGPQVDIRLPAAPDVSLSADLGLPLKGEDRTQAAKAAVGPGAAPTAGLEVKPVPDMGGVQAPGPRIIVLPPPPPVALARRPDVQPKAAIAVLPPARPLGAIASQPRAAPPAQRSARVLPDQAYRAEIPRNASRPRQEASGRWEYYDPYDAYYGPDRRYQRRWQRRWYGYDEEWGY